MQTAKDLRDNAEAELLAMIEDCEKEIFELRNELKTNRKLEKPHLLREKKREKARILTILTEKKREA